MEGYAMLLDNMRRILLTVLGLVLAAALIVRSQSNINGPTPGLSTFPANALITNAAPTISSGFGTTPSIVQQNGTAAFTLNVGTGGTATTGVIGLPTAAHGWNCYVTDTTTNSTTVFVTKQTASSVSSATIGNFSDVAAASAWAASDVLAVSCFAY